MSDAKRTGDIHKITNTVGSRGQTTPIFPLILRQVNSGVRGHNHSNILHQSRYEGSHSTFASDNGLRNLLLGLGFLFLGTSFLLVHYTLSESQRLFSRSCRPFQK